jgi:acetyl esterase/lipase
MAQAHVAVARAAPNWKIYRDVQYGPSPEEKADLYLLNRGVNPAVVLIHGGGWQAGDKASYDGYYAELYARAGYHVVAINYRLAKLEDGATQWNAQLQDAQLAIRWLRRLSGLLRIDPNRIGAIGDSAGGQLALLLGSLPASQTNLAGGPDLSALYSAQSPKVAAVVDMFGPTDLTQPNMYQQLSSLAVFGARAYAQTPGLYRSASPLLAVHRRTAPTCIVQGLGDTIVPASQSVALRDRLSSLRVRHKWIPFVGGHWFLGLAPQLKQFVDLMAVHCISEFLRPNPWNAL